MSSTDQCAVGADGELLPASKIIFFNDPDDANPLPPVSDASLFRRSGRSRKQSSRLTDPDNAELKRKASDDDIRPSTRTRHSSPSSTAMDVDQDEDQDDNIPELQPVSDSSDDGGDGSEDDGETDIDAINAAYEQTKALGDADRVAMKTRPKRELTKDIQPLFKEDEVLDPDTGVLIKGHWCLLCK
ncbi:hypothetical protein B0H12DRAFT_378867 [Mycena haematopus]|nr:hypothetical protein B0H12DRAFT_378867 [Mycena haematopus]